MKPTITLIFDRSAFHGDRFEILKRSPLMTLIKRGRVLVHHTPTFLEETISLYVKPENRDQLKTQLPFILEMCNGRWFLEPAELWHLELVQHAGPQANVFVKEARRRDAEKRLREGVLGAQVWGGLLTALPLKDAERQKQIRLRETHVEMREEIAKVLRAASPAKPFNPPPARQMIEEQSDDWGLDLVDRFVCHRDKPAIHSAWLANKARCPFFTSFVEGMLYAAWFAMAEVNKKIDLNAQVDLQLLCGLNRADAIVSSDQKFLKDAFTELWLRKGKRFYTPEELVLYLKLLT